MDDLAVFLSARQRADAVDEWLKGKVAGLQEHAEQRRAGQLRQCGAALGAMRERGESVRDIARMAGISEKAVRELIRAPVADGAAVVAAEDRAGAVQPEPADGAPRVRRVSRADACGRVSAGGAGARGHMSATPRGTWRAAVTRCEGCAQGWGFRNHYGWAVDAGAHAEEVRGLSRWWCAGQALMTVNLDRRDRSGRLWPEPSGVASGDGEAMA